MILIDQRHLDGSRHFASWPLAATWGTIHNHVQSLPSVETVNLVGGEIAAGWIDFTFRGHRFVVHRHEGHF